VTARVAPADDPTQDTLMRLAAVPGHSLAQGLSSLLGDADKYVRLMHKFVDMHAPDMSRLGSSLAAADPVTTRHLVHTLRGLAATLGAEQIAANAGVLDDALLADPTGRHLADEQAPAMLAIRDGFTALLAALAPAGPGTAAPGESAGLEKG
jgi:HPt (histidine-containing phosphotransfer) domain-containing protein